MKNYRFTSVLLSLFLSAILFACSQEKVKPVDSRIARIAAIQKEIAIAKATRSTNLPTWSIKQVPVFYSNAGTTTVGTSGIRTELWNNAGQGLEVQLVYNGSDNGQLIFRDWSNVGTPYFTHYYNPNGSSGGWREILFDMPAAYLTATSDVYVTIRWRSFTKSGNTETSTSDWSYFNVRWYHGNVIY